MQKGSELCDDEAPFAVFAVVAANYQRSMQRSPRESWAADARRTTEQRHARYYVRCFSLFFAVFGNISASYDSIFSWPQLYQARSFLSI